MTKLTYEDNEQSVEIMVKRDDMIFSDFMEVVVRPILNAVYSETLVEKWLNG